MANRFDRFIRGIRTPVRTRTFLGRLSPGDGPVEMCSLDEAAEALGVNIQTLLDSISSTQGAILYRNATMWVALAPGTSGQVLQTGGPSANPSWLTLTKELRLMGSLAGKPTAAQELFYLTHRSTDTFPSGASGSFLECQVAPADGDAVFTLKKNGSSVGTGTIPNGMTVGSWTISSNITLTNADNFALYAPGVADSAMSGVSYTLSGTRTA